jgi:phage baseplate assembly protein gpV
VSRVSAALQAIARHEVDRRPFCELGVVTSVFASADGDGDAHSVGLTLKDSGLAVPRAPVASLVAGAAALPRVGDVVLVLFPRGDLASAVVAGQVYSDQRRPPTFDRDEAALVWPGDTDDVDTKAVRISLKADGSARTLDIQLGGDLDARLTVTDGEVTLRAGGVQLRLHHGSDSDGTVEVAGGGSKITLAQDGDVTIESAGKLTLKGQQVALSGDTQVTVNGQTVSIN